MSRDEQLLMAGIQIAVALAGILATCWVALAVGRGQKRSSAESQALLSLLADGTQRQRRDEIIRSLATERDVEYLKALEVESRAMDQFSRREVMKAYHRNPVVKLPTYDWPGASVAAAITDALAERYEEVRLRSELGDLGRFADLCFRHDMEVWRIAKVVADELRRGNSPGDSALQDFLDDRPSAELAVELAASLLCQLNSIHEDLGTWPSRDILYAVSASLSRRFEQSAPTDGQRRYLCVAVAGVVYRLNILRLAEWTDHSAAGPDECVAQLMRLCSHILGVDDHLDMRILESLPAILARFTHIAGTAKDDLRCAWSTIDHMYSDPERRVGSVTLQALKEVEQHVHRLAPVEVQ